WITTGNMEKSWPVFSMFIKIVSGWMEYFPFYTGYRWTIFHLLAWLRKYCEVCGDEKYAD
ncbi:MAG: hypothetical protein PHR86_10245, partial [Desulfobacterales bacterium]|nr:hypothetical protein [Desulfobacterales bacterium]